MIENVPIAGSSPYRRSRNVTRYMVSTPSFMNRAAMEETPGFGRPRKARRWRPSLCPTESSSWVRAIIFLVKIDPVTNCAIVFSKFWRIQKLTSRRWLGILYFPLGMFTMKGASQKIQDLISSPFIIVFLFQGKRTLHCYHYVAMLCLPYLNQCSRFGIKFLIWEDCRQVTVVVLARLVAVKTCLAVVIRNSGMYLESKSWNVHNWMQHTKK